MWRPTTKWDQAKWDQSKWDQAKWDQAKWDRAKWDLRTSLLLVSRNPSPPICARHFAEHVHAQCGAANANVVQKTHRITNEIQAHRAARDWPYQMRLATVEACPVSLTPRLTAFVCATTAVRRETETGAGPAPPHICARWD